MKRLLTLSMIAGMLCFAQAEMITNGNFETGDMTGWGWYGSGSGAGSSAFWAEVKPNEGNLSRIDNYYLEVGMEQVLPWWGWCAAWPENYVAATPGSTYTIYVDIRDAGDGDGIVEINMRWRDSSDSLISTDTFDFYATNQWQLYSSSAIAPATASKLYIDIGITSDNILYQSRLIYALRVRSTAD